MKLLIMRYAYRSIQAAFRAVRETWVTFVSASPTADVSSRIPLSCWSVLDDFPSCSSSSFSSPLPSLSGSRFSSSPSQRNVPLSSELYGCKNSVGLASVFPAEFRNVNMRSKKAKKIISLFCEINHAYIFKITFSVTYPEKNVKTNCVWIQVTKLPSQFQDSF